MTPAHQTSRQRWFAWIAALVFVLIAVSMLSIVAWRSWHDKLQESLNADVSLSRSLELDLTQSLQVVRLLAQRLPVDAQSLRESVRAQPTEQIALLRDLQNLQAPFPFLRSLSLVDRNGYVLLSTHAANQGLVVGLDDLLPQGGEGYDGYRIGVPKPGRDLVGAQASGPAAALDPKKVYFFTMALDLDGGEEPVRLLFTVNPDFFITQFGQRLKEGEDSVQLLRQDGVVLASSSPSAEIGGRVSSDLLKRVEDADFGVLDLPAHPLWRYVSYRSSSKFPLVLAVYAHNDGLWRSWREVALLQVGVLSPLMLLLALVGGGLWRARSRAAAEQVRSLVTQEQTLERLVQQRTLELQAKQAELEQAALAAQAASHTKSEFLALMSHELRTPMSGVVGMLSLALKTELSGTQRQQIALARYNAESLLTIVNDLLDLSKIEAGKLEIERIDFDAGQMLRDSTQMLRERADRLGLAFHVNLDPALPTYVLGDPTRLRQVLINLIGNALKFTQAGSVSVNVAPLAQPPLAWRAPDQLETPWWRFEVADTGIGMSPDALGRMFQKFEQADTSTTRKFGGTGLGLSICKLLVEIMGGQIGVDSEVGVGSVFWFAIPLPEGQRPQEVEADRLVPHARRLKVLVAEDVPTNQIIIESMLQHMGHECTLVENGALALHALSRKDFDLVLMDGRMPVMDGLEAARHIRRGGHGDDVVRQPQIPIVALTANASEQDRKNFLAAGMDVFLTKPVDEVALHKTLADIIAQNPVGAVSSSVAAGAVEVDAPQDAQAAALALLDDLLLGGANPGPETQVVAAPAPEADLSALDALLSDFGACAPNSGPNSVPKSAPESAQDSSPVPLPSSSDRESRAAALKAKMLATFKDQVPQRLQEIEAAMTANDWNTAATVVHGIKGSVAYIWPDSEVYHLAAEMEKMADSGQTLAFAERFGVLQSLLAELQNA